MKKCLMLFLCLLALAGCAGREKTETMPLAQTAETFPPVAVQPPTEVITQTQPEPENEDFVRVCDYLPTVRQELMYATDQNFTGREIYEFEDAWLRYGTVKKLAAVSADLEELGVYLKIWDGFRPVSAQFALWEACPDAAYVANPNVKFSSHSRGNTVDVTLVDADGLSPEMPTHFDDFSAMADRDYSDCSPAAASNARILELIMEKHGFRGYFKEWWHYTDTTDYPVEEEFDPAERE